MDFGMPFLLETETLEDCITLCEHLGLSFIEWNMSFPQCQLSKLDVGALNRIRKEKNLYYTLHMDENFSATEFNDRVRNAYLDTFSEAIQYAKALEIPILNLHLAKGVYVTLPEKKEFLYQTFRTHYLTCIRAFRDLCDRQIGAAPLQIAVENTSGFAPHEQEALALLLESDHFGLTLDIGHSHVVGDVDLPFYERYHDRLIHMHAHDAKGTQNHLAFGAGDIDLRQRLAMARAVQARVVLETKTIQALKQTIAYRDHNL